MRRILTTLATSATLLSACRSVSTTATPTNETGLPARTTARFPTTWRFQPGNQATFAAHAMVVSNDSIASRVGRDIMAKGGNAIDAAVATGFALAVTYPAAGNIGGGGFMVIRLADGRTAALDYREIAPLAATRNMYLDENGNLIRGKSTLGHLAVGVPGAVAGMAEALAKYGTMSLAEVIAPAISLAEDGFVVDSGLMRNLNGSRRKIEQFEGKNVYYPNGQVVQAGVVFKQPELAWTLKQIAAKGPKGFYTGPVADSLVAEMQRGGGIITVEDLARYRPEWRKPIETTYRGNRIISMPPASSGGITMTEVLNILETYDTPAPYGSTQWAHRFAEANQRAFLDRNNKLGDPAFVNIPSELTSKAYAKQIRAKISDQHHTPTGTLVAIREPMHTTHYSVVDAKGNAVATTTTLNGSYGSGVWVRGAGFFLNNEMDDFAAKPGEPNMFGLVQGEQNAVAPGKRMLSAMTPTVVLDKRGQVLMVVGGAGGPTIITGTTQVILNVLDYKMSLADAMRAPRLHHQSLPDTLEFERGGLEPAVIDSLRAMGHAVDEVGSLVNINAILRVNGGWNGVNEPRSVGGAVGY